MSMNFKKWMNKCVKEFNKLNIHINTHYKMHFRNIKNLNQHMNKVQKTNNK